MTRTRIQMRLPATIFLTLLLLTSSGCYYAKQGSYAIKYQFRAEPNKKLLAKSTTPKDMAEFLAMVEEIRSFAADSLGLIKNGSYSSYVKIDRAYLLDNVYAARPDTFAQYFWKYPFLGAMPYKGFFEHRDAEKEAAALQKKGYDVLIGEVIGYSSLGIVNDPVYSFMAKYGPYYLANLIFHELTHATIFRKNQTQFNEEIASFIGREGALRYIAFKFGAGSEKHRKVLLSLADNDTYRRTMSVLYHTLDSVYRNEPLRERRIEAKKEIISRFRRTFAESYDSVFSTKNYTDIAQSIINNASLMIHMTYLRDLELYYQLFDRCGKNMKETVSMLGRIGKMKGRPKENLRKWLGGSR